MLQYFKRYSIYVSAIAIALPVIVSTVWPLVTGQMMAASLSGLAMLFVLFIGGLILGYAIFGKRADAETQAYLDAYNDDCDPQRLVNEGAKLAQAIQFPCDQSGSWFMGYYAQALLDLGRKEEALNIQTGIKNSMDVAKNAPMKVGILANLLPLVEKSEGTQAALQLIDEGMALCDQLKDGGAQIRDYLASQKKILDVEATGTPEEIAKLCASIADSDKYPMRIRVEYAWREGSAQYKADDLAGEKRSLRFVVDHGGKLALVGKAKARLDSLT